MMRSIWTPVFAAFVLLLASAEAVEQNCEAETDEITCSDNLEKLFEEGNAAFTGRFLYEAVKSSPGENLIMSPYSVLTPLAKLALYSNGNTKDQLLKVLNLPQKSDIRCLFPKLISNLRAEQNVILNVASKVYSTDTYPLTEKFLSDTKQIFDAEAESLNFNARQDAANRINKWVEGETNNRIKDIASPDMFGADTRLVLANAIYFLGNWIRQFNARSTMNRPFYINSKRTVQIPTMYQENNFKYGESSKLDCKVLEMYYKGGDFSFVVFLPNKIDGLHDLVNNLQDSNNFYEAYDNTRFEKVRVFLPKMKIDSTFGLEEIMKKVGIVDLLDSRSNLTCILEEFEPLYVSAAIQKAFVEVDEKGTEAAAANLFGFGSTSLVMPSPTYIFRADRPFAFYILNKRNILFSATFVTK